MQPWRTALLLLCLAVAAAAAPPPPPTASGAQPAEPGEGEAAVLAGLAAAMGADPDVLASWNETVASEGSLCGWPSQPGASTNPDILGDNATGAITECKLATGLGGGGGGKDAGACEGAFALQHAVASAAPHLTVCSCNGPGSFSPSRVPTPV